jgi:RNA polymerase subunit RPABC4/transcription elongation factor Spt4
MKHIEDLEVINPRKSYINKKLGIEVFFKDPGWGVSPLRQLLPYIASVMDPSCSTVRKVPFLSCGWTTANPNAYITNRSTIVGSISPFLSDGRMKFLEQRYKKDVVDLACHLVESFSPLGIHRTPFYHSDPKIRDVRKEMARTFLEILNVSSKDIHKKFFLAEGIGFIFNNFVPFHLDGMNDPSSGMNETLAINCQYLINKELSLVPMCEKSHELISLGSRRSLILFYGVIL